MKKALIQTTATIKGEKYTRSREVDMPETIEEAIKISNGEENALAWWRAEYRRRIQLELRSEIEAELGLRPSRNAQALMRTLDIMGIDYGNERREHALLEILQNHLASPTKNEDASEEATEETKAKKKGTKEDSVA